MINSRNKHKKHVKSSDTITVLRSLLRCYNQFGWEIVRGRNMKNKIKFISCWIFSALQFSFASIRVLSLTLKCWVANDHKDFFRMYKIFIDWRIEADTSFAEITNEFHQLIIETNQLGRDCIKANEALEAAIQDVMQSEPLNSNVQSLH